MDYSRYYEARDILEDFFRKDLLGPVREDEIISDTWPSDYYITGRLFPQGMELRQEDMEENLLDDDIEGSDQAINMCHSAYPSSMGISFTVSSRARKLRVRASFAWYVPQEKEGGTSRKKKTYEWHRQTRSVWVEILTDKKFQETELLPGLVLRTYLQKEYRDGSRTLTVAMVNTRKKQMDIIANNAATFFQPKIEVFGEKEGDGVFIEKKLRVSLGQDSELLNLEMLYRHNRTFAIGHGCSAGWKSSGDYATEVYTEFLPAYELFQMKPATHVSTKILTFKFLGESPREQVCKGLEEIAASYERWIAERRYEIPSLPEKYHDVATKNLENCEESLKRIRAGIDLLSCDRMVFRAFQLVNQAMLRLRLQIGGSTRASDHGWYPFQLAFILQEISSIANPEDPYREVVDLLWFPTGGGKTEAYLGLAAFTIFLRRMRAASQGQSGGGVAIMMRYTLRLLTLQQFERASALICACELMRRENPGLLGEEEIAAGLWVGGGLTPNRREDAARSLEKILKEGFEALKEDEANPCQVLTCPWCKTQIRPQYYTVNRDRMLIRCPDASCDFHNGLPVYVVDEDLYDHGPALVVGTVDKFARMTWEEKVGKLFGLRSSRQSPELIIQDELHLISGPLGTIAGLYEVAVDEFCKHGNKKAKIISSTATIRNAAGQILNLYGRDFRQFPPQGLDIRDSYFAEEARGDEKPTRKYLGILAPGTSGNTLLIRVYSILLFATRYLAEREFPEEVVDSFWTLTGYFNSLKQLGGAVINVIDDVHGRLKYLYQTKFKGAFSAGKVPPEELNFDELTSRKPNSEISKTLKRLEAKYPDQEAFDLVLASNMLSVGIDIGRLGLMAVQGQPKLNSEYIQATSRVGRQTPGLVVIMYDASRSRDRSHYEQYLSFHSSLYRYVEATSLTPFAERARDRAMHAVLISLCRHLIDELRGNRDAGNISGVREKVEAQIDKILERVRRVDPSELEASREQLYGILDYWEQKASSDLVYQKYFNQQGIPLLTDRFDSEDDAIPTLNSMRNVDIECDVLLLEG